MAICAVSFLLIIFALVDAAWTYRARLVILQTLNTSPMSDVEAVELTRQALHEVGEDVTLFRPRAYNGRDLFARNTLTPSDGYVIWDPVTPGSHPGFAVNVEQSGSTVRCEVCQCK